MTRRFATPYPGYDILSRWDSPSYNDITRAVLAHRLREVPERRFLSEAHFRVLEALCDAVLPQDERADPVAIAPWIDAALADRRGSGTRFADMPHRREAWPKGLAAFDAEARARHGTGFSDLPAQAREALLKAVDDEDVQADWGDLPPKRFLRQAVLKDIVAFYYSHPTGQNEIGYGGPAAIRGYVRMGASEYDPWEAPQGRWEAVENGEEE